MSETKNRKNQTSTNQGGDSDIVSFWLLLLFVAVFFGIAAEEARRPMFGFGKNEGLESETQRLSADHAPTSSIDLISSEQTTRASK